MARQAGARGDFATIAALKARLRELPVTMAGDIAKVAGPEMTNQTRDAFESGRSVYGEPRPVSKVDGHPLTLRDTGKTAERLEFKVEGRIIRAALGTKWAKYLIGKYGVLPNGAMPAEWSRKLREITAEFKAVLR